MYIALGMGEVLLMAGNALLISCKGLPKNLMSLSGAGNFEIDEVARKPKAPLELGGRESAEAWRSAFKAEQESWERYRQQRCQNAQEFENYPGNGAWATQCSLRLTLERLREIVDGY